MFEKGKIYPPPWGLLEVHSSHIFRIEISSTEQMLCLPWFQCPQPESAPVHDCTADAHRPESNGWVWPVSVRCSPRSCRRLWQTCFSVVW